MQYLQYIGAQVRSRGRKEKGGEGASPKPKKQSQAAVIKSLLTCDVGAVQLVGKTFSVPWFHDYLVFFLTNVGI